MTGHPVYGVGTPALVYIGDEVATPGGTRPATVVAIEGNRVWVTGPGIPSRQSFIADRLALFKRAEP